MNGPFGVDISRATDLTPSTSPARAPTSLQIGYSAARAGDVTTKYQRDLGPIFTNLIKKLPFFQVSGHVPARHKPTVASSAPAPTPPQFDARAHLSSAFQTLETPPPSPPPYRRYTATSPLASTQSWIPIPNPKSEILNQKTPLPAQMLRTASGVLDALKQYSSIASDYSTGKFLSEARIDRPIWRLKSRWKIQPFYAIMGQLSPNRIE